MDEIREIMEQQGVSRALLDEIEAFRRKSGVDSACADRVQVPELPFYGREIFEMAAHALLEGENILLTGTKATGKNMLAENLAWLFGRPLYNISFHVSTDAASLVGTDTFRNNEVTLRTGPVWEAAAHGGFAVLDEVNMARNDAVSVLHAALDYRRVLDVPGYGRRPLHEATRFIGTMNYGYAGTRELNEALVSRFLVIEMPAVTEETIYRITARLFPDMKKEAERQCAGLFLDLQTKAANHEISTRPLDMRGLIGALRTVRGGLSPRPAIRMGIVNKTFDPFERELVEDIIATRIPEAWTAADFFEG